MNSVWNQHSTSASLRVYTDCCSGFKISTLARIDQLLAKSLAVTEQMNPSRNTYTHISYATGCQTMPTIDYPPLTPRILRRAALLLAQALHTVSWAWFALPESANENSLGTVPLMLHICCSPQLTTNGFFWMNAQIRKTHGRWQSPCSGLVMCHGTVNMYCICTYMQSIYITWANMRQSKAAMNKHPRKSHHRKTKNLYNRNSGQFHGAQFFQIRVSNRSGAFRPEHWCGPIGQTLLGASLWSTQVAHPRYLRDGGWPAAKGKYTTSIISWSQFVARTAGCNQATSSSLISHMTSKLDAAGIVPRVFLSVPVLKRAPRHLQIINSPQSGTLTVKTSGWHSSANKSTCNKNWMVKRWTNSCLDKSSAKTNGKWMGLEDGQEFENEETKEKQGESCLQNEQGETW